MTSRHREPKPLGERDRNLPSAKHIKSKAPHPGHGNGFVDTGSVMLPGASTLLGSEAAANRRVLTDMYRMALAAGPWSGEGSGGVPTSSITGLARDLANVAWGYFGSTEFSERARAATAADVVRLYRECLGREPESQEVIAQRVGKPLLDVAIDEFARCEEFARRLREVRDDEVASLYRACLGHDPESAEAAAQWRGRPAAEVAVSLAGSEESRSRSWEHPGCERLRCLHGIFFPADPATPEWYLELDRILTVHGLGVPAVVAQLHAMAQRRAGLEIKNPDLLRGAEWRKPNCENFGSRVTLVVPTVNSERWIAHVAKFYVQMGVPVLFAVDDRTTDSTRQVLERQGANFIRIRGDHPRVEALIPDLLTKIDTEWVLRLDDDELPTPALIEFVDRCVEYPSPFTWGFPRAHLIYDAPARELRYSQFLPFGHLGGGDLQWRLFTRVGVELDPGLHTPGFVPKMPRAAQPEAYILHFDWVLRSLPQRIEKLQIYERQDQARALAHAHFQLHEIVPQGWHMFSHLPARRYAALAQSLYYSREFAGNRPTYK